MRVVGYCIGCGKFRSVKVTSASFARLAAGAGVASGTCAECERQEDEERAERDALRIRGRGGH